MVWNRNCCSRKYNCVVISVNVIGMILQCMYTFLFSMKTCVIKLSEEGETEEGETEKGETEEGK